VIDYLFAKYFLIALIVSCCIDIPFSAARILSAVLSDSGIIRIIIVTVFSGLVIGFPFAGCAPAGGLVCLFFF
jgi:hypothetical protein